MNFDQLSQQAQVSRLRRTALEALRAYPFAVKSLRLLNHGFNTTFRVETQDGHKFALRLNVNSRRSVEQISAEMAWLSALSRETELQVPAPVPTRGGELLQQVWSADLGRALPAALFTWLPGRNLDEADGEGTPQQWREVGRAAATLHRHALTWELPEGAALHSLEDPLMGSPNNMQGDTQWLNDEAREVLNAVLGRATQALNVLFNRDQPRALHADLHGGNIKSLRGQLGLFDFDDSGLGVPAQDLAISAYYLRPAQELENAMLEGYASVQALPHFTQDEFEAVVAGRNVLLLNDLLTISTADIRALLPRYVPNSVTKLRAYLDSGVFKHDVPGLVKSND